MSAESLRAGVVIVIRHPVENLVMAFERGDVAGAWQLPQGGIDVGEQPVDAAWRELGEEAGLTAADVALLRYSDEWLGYRYPDGVRRNGRHIGQCQQWFTFVARSGDVVPTPDQREFVDWKWMSAEDLTAQVVEFRRPSYRIGLGLG